METRIQSFGEGHLNEAHAESEVHDYDFGQMAQLFAEGFASISQAENKDIILVLGESGEGKSSLINYLGGCEMELERRGLTENVKVSEPIVNESVGYPVLYECKATPSDDEAASIYLCDTPGVDDVLKSEQKIVPSVLIELVAKIAHSTKLIFVISASSLNVKRGASLIKMIKTINELTGSAQAIEKKIHFVITKLDQSLPDYFDKEMGAHVESVKELLEDIGKSAEERFNDLSSEMQERMKSAGENIKDDAVFTRLRSEAVDCQNILRMLAVMHDDTISVLNYFDSGESRASFFQHIASMEALTGDEIDFNAYSRANQVFYDHIDHIAKKGIDAIEDSLQLQNQRKKITQELKESEELNQQFNTLSTSIADKPVEEQTSALVGYYEDSIATFQRKKEEVEVELQTLSRALEQCKSKINKFDLEREYPNPVFEEKFYEQRSFIGKWLLGQSVHPFVVKIKEPILRAEKNPEERFYDEDNTRLSSGHYRVTYYSEVRCDGNAKLQLYCKTRDHPEVVTQREIEQSRWHRLNDQIKDQLSKLNEVVANIEKYKQLLEEHDRDEANHETPEFSRGGNIQDLEAKLSEIDDRLSELREFLTEHGSFYEFIATLSRSLPLRPLVGEFIELFIRSGFNSQKVASIGEKLEKKASSDLYVSPHEGLLYQPVPGDGHCLFHAVGLYLGEDADFLRRVATAHMEANVSDFIDFCEGNEEKFSQRLKAIRETDAWGGHLEIEAIQRTTSRPVIIFRQDANPTIPDNHSDYTEPPIFLFYDGATHYDAFVIKDGYDAGEILQSILERIENGKNIRFNWTEIDDSQFSEKGVIQPDSLLVKPDIGEVEPHSTEVVELSTSQDPNSFHYHNKVSTLYDSDDDVFFGAETNRSPVTDNNTSPKSVDHLNADGQGAQKDDAEHLIDEKPSESSEITSSRLYEMLEIGLPVAKSVENKEVILVVGAPGVGKSSLINYLLGCEFSRINQSDGLPIQLKCENPIAPVNESILVDKNHIPLANYTLTDEQSAFMENEVVFCESNLLVVDELTSHDAMLHEMMFRAAKSARIVIALPEDALRSSHGEAFVNLLNNVQSLFRILPNGKFDYLFVVTKSNDTSLQLGDVGRNRQWLDCLGHFKASVEQRYEEQFESFSSEALRFEDFVVESGQISDIVSYHSWLVMLNDLLDNNDKSFVVDVANASERHELLGRINALSPTSIECFNFICDSRYRQTIENELNAVSVFGLHALNKSQACQQDSTESRLNMYRDSIIKHRPLFDRVMDVSEYFPVVSPLVKKFLNKKDELLTVYAFETELLETTSTDQPSITPCHSGVFQHDHVNPKASDMGVTP